MDAADTMNTVAMLIAAYCQRIGTAPDILQSYLRIEQQEIQTAGPQGDDRAHLAVRQRL